MTSAATEGPIVSIVEDDEELRLSLDSLFRSVGLKTCMFANAREFLSQSAQMSLAAWWLMSVSQGSAA